MSDPSSEFEAKFISEMHDRLMNAKDPRDKFYFTLAKEMTPVIMRLARQALLANDEAESAAALTDAFARWCSANLHALAAQLTIGAPDAELKQRAITMVMVGIITESLERQAERAGHGGDLNHAANELIRAMRAKAEDMAQAQAQNEAFETQ